MQEASTPLQEASTLLETWDLEYENDYKGNEDGKLIDAGELILSEMMGVKLDSTQHNAIRKLIKENKFDPIVWRTANDKREFPSDCNKDGTYNHCIFMGVHENGPVYLDQWGNYVDKNLNQYDVVGIPNEFGLYEFKIHEPVQQATKSSEERSSDRTSFSKTFDNWTNSAPKIQEENERSSRNSNEFERISSERISSDSGASESLLESWKKEQTKIYNEENSDTLVMSDIMGIELTKKQHEVIEELIANKNFEPRMWRDHNLPFNFTYKDGSRNGKVLMGVCFDDHLTLDAVERLGQTDVFLDEEGNYVDEQGNTGYSIVSDTPDEDGLYTFKKNIQGAVQLSPEQDEYIETLEKYPKTIALGKAIIALLDYSFPLQDAGLAEVNVPVTDVQIVSTETEGNNSTTIEAQEIPTTTLYTNEEVISYNDEDKIQKRVDRAIKNNDGTADENAYQYMFTDSSLIDLLEDESIVIKDIVQSFVKGNVLQNEVQKVNKEGRRRKIADLKKTLENTGIKKITHALILPENNMEQDFGIWNDFEGLKNICEKLEIFLLQITSYIHTNTCTGTKDFVGKIKRKVGLGFYDENIRTCEQNKFFIYNQMYIMVRDLRVVFEGLKKKFYPERPDIEDELKKMEEIVKILNHYEEYYIKHRESRSSYDKREGGKTQRKRKTRKFRKMKNKAKSHKKRLRIKSRKLR